MKHSMIKRITWDAAQAAYMTSDHLPESLSFQIMHLTFETEDADIITFDEVVDQIRGRIEAASVSEDDNLEEIEAYVNYMADMKIAIEQIKALPWVES